MPVADSEDNHEHFTRLLLESEPAMLRSIQVAVPHRADAREIMQETAVALWRQFDTYDSSRPFTNWAMGFARIETRRFELLDHLADTPVNVFNLPIDLRSLDSHFRMGAAFFCTSSTSSIRLRTCHAFESVSLIFCLVFWSVRVMEKVVIRDHSRAFPSLFLKSAGVRVIVVGPSPSIRRP